MTQKPRKRSIEATLEVDGIPLRWTIKREPQYPRDDGYGGLTLSVQTTGKARRELVLEYPFPKVPAGKAHFIPQRPDIVPEKIEADIRLAMEAGWDPWSRGRPFNFQVPIK